MEIIGIMKAWRETRDTILPHDEVWVLIDTKQVAYIMDGQWYTTMAHGIDITPIERLNLCMWHAHTFNYQIRMI